MNLWRPLFCPVCGAPVRVEVTDTNLPEVHEIPDHASANGMNLCQGLMVTVTLDWATCPECGCNMHKHPSGVCMRCFKEKR